VVRVQGLAPHSSVTESATTDGKPFDPPAGTADAAGKFPSSATHALVLPYRKSLAIDVGGTRSDGRAFTVHFSYT
jgi:hypothetical protein